MCVRQGSWFPGQDVLFASAGRLDANERASELLEMESYGLIDRYTVEMAREREIDKQAVVYSNKLSLEDVG